jgi:phage FluMu protein Com
VTEITKWYCWNCGFKTAAMTTHKGYIDSIDANCPRCKGTMNKQSPDPGEKVKVIKTKKKKGKDWR